MLKRDGDVLLQLRIDAANGDAEAQYKLGHNLIYEYGKDQRKNQAEALIWFLKAATQGHVSAQYACGLMYEKGQGTGRNLSEATKWYRNAAENGNAAAQYALGFAFVRGRGVPRNDAEALRCYLKSSDGGNINAQFPLSIYYYSFDKSLHINAQTFWCNAARTEFFSRDCGVIGFQYS